MNDYKFNIQDKINDSITDNLPDYNKLVNYVSNDKEGNYKYLYNLFKLYRSLKEKFNDNYDLMNKYEDKVYTVRGKLFNQIERIKLELGNITSKVSARPKYLSQDDLGILHYLNNNISSLAADDLIEIDYYKRQIARFQAKLDIKITFLKAAYDVSEDLLNNALVNKDNNSNQESSMGR